MASPTYTSALIVGAGQGLSAAQPRGAWTWEIELRPWVERF
jgi:hypothetical protein